MEMSAEDELLERITRNSGFPSDVQARYKVLRKKLRAGRITPAEYDELLRFTEEGEAMTVRRVEAVIELAQLRGVSFQECWQSLGIKPPPVE